MVLKIVSYWNVKASYDGVRWVTILKSPSKSLAYELFQKEISLHRYNYLTVSWRDPITKQGQDSKWVNPNPIIPTDEDEEKINSQVEDPTPIGYPDMIGQDIPPETVLIVLVGMVLLIFLMGS